MGKGENGRANASLVISMLALLMAVTGVATAAKDSGTSKLPPNSVGSVQLKPGAVKAPDLAKNSVVTSKVAPNAVTTKALAPDAVKSKSLAPDAVTTEALAPDAVTADALAPNSVTGPSLAANSVVASSLAPNAVTPPAIAPNAVTNQKLATDAVSKEKIQASAVGSDQLEGGAVTTNKIGPKAVTALKIDTTPGAQVSSTSTAMTGTFMSCYYRTDVPFSTVDRNVDGVYDPSSSARLKAPISGIYRVTGGVSWPVGTGTVRALSVSRNIGSGPNIGQHYTVQSVSTAPAADSPTDQTIAFDVALDQDDYLTMDLTTCGASLSAGKSNFGMVWAGPSS